MFNQVDFSSHAGTQKFMTLVRPAAVGKKKVVCKGEYEKKKNEKMIITRTNSDRSGPKFDNGCCY